MQRFNVVLVYANGTCHGTFLLRQPFDAAVEWVTAHAREGAKNWSKENVNFPPVLYALIFDTENGATFQYKVGKNGYLAPLHS